MHCNCGTLEFDLHMLTIAVIVLEIVMKHSVANNIMNTWPIAAFFKSFTKQYLTQEQQGGDI